MNTVIFPKRTFHFIHNIKSAISTNGHSTLKTYSVYGRIQVGVEWVTADFIFQ